MLKCQHGYPFDAADECQECVKLEIARMEVIHEVEQEMLRVTGDTPEDRALRALFLTAVGRYVSMKLHRLQDANRVLQGALLPLRTALPCGPDERLLASHQLLMELSYAEGGINGNGS